jgi:hypothetical protein
VGSYYSAIPFVAIPREEEPAVAALLVLAEDDATPYTGVNSGEVQGAGESLDTDDGCTSYTAASAEAVRRLLLLCVVLAVEKIISREI